MCVRDRERERDAYECVTFSPLTEVGLWRSNRAWHEERIEIQRDRDRQID